MGLVNHGYTRERNLSPAAPSSRMLKQTQSHEINEQSHCFVGLNHNFIACCVPIC